MAKIDFDREQLCPTCKEPMQVCMPIWITPGSSSIDTANIDYESGNPQSSENWWCEICQCHCFPIPCNPLPNARFWIYWNQQHTKLTLRPGQTLCLYHHAATDEGFAYCGEEYYYDPDEKLIACTRDSGGRDCDGPIDFHNEWVCPLGRLQHHAMAVDGDPGKGIIYMPDWWTTEAWQRDVYAEDAGY